MVKRFLSDSSPFVQLLFLVFLSLISFLVISIAGTLIALPLFNIKLLQLRDIAGHMDDPKVCAVMKYLQTLQSLSLFLFPSLLFLYLITSRPSEFLGLTKNPGLYLLLLVLLIMFFLVPVNNALLEWNSRLHLPDRFSGVEQAIRRMEENAAELTQAFLTMNSFGSYVVNLFVIAVLPALSEEMMFRGAIQPLMIRWTKNNHAGVWIAAFLFSFFHFQFFGLLPRWLLGVVFGYMFLWSKNIWLPIAAHFVNNGLAVTVYYVYGSMVVEEKVDKLGTSDSGIYAVVGALLVITLLILLKNQYKPGGEVKMQ